MLDWGVAKVEGVDKGAPPGSSNPISTVGEDEDAYLTRDGWGFWRSWSRVARVDEPHPRSYAFDGHTFAVLPNLLNFPEGPTRIFLMMSAVVLLVAPAFFLTHFTVP